MPVFSPSETPLPAASPSSLPVAASTSPPAGLATSGSGSSLSSVALAAAFLDTDHAAAPPFDPHGLEHFDGEGYFPNPWEDNDQQTLPSALPSTRGPPKVAGLPSLIMA